MIVTGNYANPLLALFGPWLWYYYLILTLGLLVNNQVALNFKLFAIGNLYVTAGPYALPYIEYTGATARWVDGDSGTFGQVFGGNKPVGPVAATAPVAIAGKGETVLCKGIIYGIAAKGVKCIVAGCGGFIKFNYPEIVFLLGG